MKIILANPRGFCAGVDRAIEIVERVLALYGAPIYVRHEVVHNRYVVDGLRKKGVVFVEELDEVPDDATVIFSAHGVANTVREVAAERGLRVFDAICPLVTKVHVEVARYEKEGRECVLIGHEGHPEVVGTMGQYRRTDTGGMYLVETVRDVEALAVKDSDTLAFVTQTTLSVDDTADIIDALRQRFPKILGPRKDDICYATQNRQESVKHLAEQTDLVLVVGSKNSSNSNRLKEIACLNGVDAYLIDGGEDIVPEWLAGKKAVGVTAGASAPEVLVQNVIAQLKVYGGASVEDLDGRKETVTFSLPKVLQSVQLETV
ncbi:MAG: 4-hydroxy-3-methylbut-2-enyl diphosphate reductase [Gammaproteobacteria bacterium]|nr:4-hydroxy-3-methylbut-2-enyl diphosphate reductase [Gammaproteobacteria bacterium]